MKKHQIIVKTNLKIISNLDMNTREGGVLLWATWISLEGVWGHAPPALKIFLNIYSSETRSGGI